MKLDDLGYNDFFEANREKLGFAELPVARVVSEHKGAYRVKNVEGEYWAKMSGKQMFDAASREDYPAVGDWVVIIVIDDENGIIQGILPRSSMIKRRSGDKNRNNEKDKIQIVATNIDLAFVVESIDRDYNLNRLERYVTIVKNAEVKPVIVLNKVDLITDIELDEKINQINNRLSDVDLILTSIFDDGGLELLRKYVTKGKTCCFLGSSGVGKSSLINKLLGGEVIRTEQISSFSGRGKHTTTNRQMYFLDNGGIVIDNPGIREVGLLDMDERGASLFDEIVQLGKGCKYTDCMHIHEDECAVRVALESGELDREKYLNYVRLKKEVQHYEMTEQDKRAKDRKFGKFIKNAKKQFRKGGFEDYG